MNLTLASDGHSRTLNRKWAEVKFVDVLFFQLPDGSLRTPDGKFASITGMPAPGTSDALNFAKVLADNGIDVVGTELEVDGPLGVRRYDIGTRNPDGTIFGLEIKTGGAARNSYQEFSDMYINQFGAAGRGRIAGQMVTGSMTIYLPSGGW